MGLRQKVLLSAAGLAACSFAVFGPGTITTMSRSLATAESEALIVDETTAHRILQSGCAATELESFEDFEDGDLSGWTLSGGWESQTVDNTHPESFTSFLGRFGKEQTATKTYPLTPGAGGAQLSFLFYEIDSWDATSYGHNDKMYVTINGVQVDLGYFEFSVNEGTRTGSVSGIEWTMTEESPRKELGFNGKWWGDQMHYIEMDIPEDLIHSNTLEVLFRVGTNEAVNNESAGIDNIKVMTCPPPPITDRSGINGDPLIMGLQGQVFRFDGRNGGWYSAISSPSLQYNMKISEYEDCPAYSDTFSTGAGFTFFDENKNVKNRLEVNVVNEHNVNVGCGAGEKHCLGFGSLEMLINGRKVSVGGDYTFDDGTGRIIVYNTYYPCANKWYDFDLNESELRGRRLANKIPVWDVIEGLKKTMIDPELCQEWLDDRYKQSNLYRQPGRYTTIIVQTEDIAFHVEYKQEEERCAAHTLNVWISEVTPKLLGEQWEGILGETKKVPLQKLDTYDRKVMLKFPEDKSYEVNSPFSFKCEGCVTQQNKTRHIHEW